MSNVEKILNHFVEITQSFIRNKNAKEISQEDILRKEQFRKKGKLSEFKVYVPFDSERTELSNVLISNVQNQFPDIQKISDIVSRGKTIGKKILFRDNDVVGFYFKPKRGFGIRNKGDVAEGILGAAIATKFLEKERFVNISQIKSTLAEQDKQKNLSENCKIVEKTLRKDFVTLCTRLSAINFQDLMDQTKSPALSDLFDSSAAFVNSSEFVSLTEDLLHKNSSEKVFVLSDGVSEQKGKKVDVRILKDGKEIEFGKISLKTGGTKQLGQIGKKWDAIASLFEMFFGIEIQTSRDIWLNAIDSGDYEQIAYAATEVYREAFENIQISLEDQVASMKRFVHGVQYSAVLDEKDIKLVHLDKGSFQILSFSNLEESLRSVNLGVSFKYPEPKNNIKTPRIVILDKKTNRPLITIRVKIEAEGRVIRHYVEKEDLLVELLTYKEKRKNEKSVF
jgi:hypothetical protein